MDTSKFTVTVPIADYNEMANAFQQLQGTNEILQMHLDLIRQNQRVNIKIDLTKKPYGVARFPNATEGVDELRFNYDQPK